MVRIFYIIFSFLPFLFYSQKNDKYSFVSSPSFHNGFEIEFTEDSNIVKFHTQNRYYVLDSLKNKYKAFPKMYFEDEILEKNKALLSNSTFEKNISNETKEQLKIIVENFAKVCKKNENISKAFDGIYFSVLTKNNKKCTIQYSQENEKKIIEELLLKIEKIYNPNSFVDKYIFETRHYLDNYISFNIKSTKPLFVKLYQMSSFGCYFFTPLIDKLPNADEIYIDITELSSYTDKDDQECMIENFNKKYKSVKIIQAKETDIFNEL